MNNIFISDEVFSASTNMTEKKMASLIHELASTQYWPAVVKYLLKRHELAQSGLFVYNPSTQAHEISRTQGILAGLSDLVGYVAGITKKSDKKQKEEEEIKDSE